MAMVAVFDVAPPIDSDTVTALPDGAVAGIWKLTWYKPTKPGASPEKLTREAASGWPPRTIVGFVKVFANGLLGDGLPRPGRGDTSPRPVQ